MKIGIIGQGSIGRRHARNFKHLGAEVLVYDPAPPADVIEPIASKEAVLACDGVVIATPPATHADLLRETIRSGAHALVEKPLAWSEASGIESVLSEAESLSRHVLVGYCWRYWPPLIDMRRMLHDGHIGTLRLARAEYGDHLTIRVPDYRASFLGGPEGGNLAEHSHALDYVRWICGPIASVKALIPPASLAIPRDDTADLLVTFQSGAVGSILTTMLAWKIESRLILYGDEGMLYWDRTREGLRSFRAATRTWTEHPSPTDINQMYMNEAAHFMACIRGEEPPRVTGRDALETVRLMDQARRSAA